ncbi:MAG: cyclopropane-fatty-acyl-phospholipid synthase family protein [Clostridiales bacterium]|nr:cyclopropane-fatty-acyl-phospholipid synthase family protein [Clostridiales bacterium]
MSQYRYLTNYLKDLIPVPFELETAEEFYQIGDGPARFHVKIKKDIPKRSLLRSTSLALGEAYMNGDLEIDGDLYDVLDTLMGEIGRFKKDSWALHSLLYTSLSRHNQEKEVTSHYDIGNDFYRLWLDETMSYSCGYFPEENISLFDAQVGKTDHILEKLQLKPGMKLLDIGCGWGFLLKRAAEHYDVKGVGITLAKEQYRQLSEEIHSAHMEDRLEVHLMDYRDLAELNQAPSDEEGGHFASGNRLWNELCAGECFDRVVSVGMIEHVGRDNYDEFFNCVDQVLKPGGLFLLHFISALEEHSGDPWIRKYIFPGGVIPSLREIISLLPEVRFYTLDVESLRRHYVRTLECWRENFSAHRLEITQKFGENFTRMWDLYLASCAAAFHHGVVDLHQILLSKGVNNELPMTRVV